MSKRIFTSSVLSVVFVFFLLLISQSVFSQAGNAQNTANDPRHETLDQRTVSVLFDQNILSATTAGWSVTVNGIAVTVNSVTVLGNRINVRFDATPAHAAAPFILPGDVVRVSYSQATGNTLTATAGNPEINSFTNFQSKNNWVFSCSSDLIFFQQGLIPAASRDICAPVVMNFTQYQYKLSLRFRNSSTFVLANIFYGIAWGDGVNQNFTPYVSDATGTANPTFIENVGFDGTNPGIILTSRPAHNYPATTTPAPNICSWDLTLTPFVNGVANCLTLTQTTIFPTYDTDNANSGTLSLQPTPLPTSNRVCLGTNVNMRFSDQTQLNCRLAAPEADVPNQLTRWIRIVYGNRDHGTGNIADIRVGGVPVTANADEGPRLFPAGYFPTGAGGIGVPDFNGVIELATPVLNSTGITFMQMITTTATTFHEVGERFYVRMDYWDVCNPYNPASPDANRVSVENFIEIVAKPNPAVALDKEFCNNATITTAGGGCPAACTNCFEVTAASVAGSTEIRWYTSLANANADVNIAAPTYGTNCRFLRPENMGGIPAAAGVYTVYARYRTSGAPPNNCLSDPIPVTITRRSALSTPGTITPLTSDVCNGSTDVPYSLGAASPVVPFGGATEYSWTFSGGAGATVDAPNTTQNITADFNIPGAFTTATRTLEVITQFTTNATVGGRCPTPASTRLVTIYGPSLGGTSSGGADYCEGTDANDISLAGQRGTILRWEVNFNGGGFVDAGVGTGVSFDPGILAPGNYVYRAVVQNGPCAPQNSTTTTINVSANPALANAGPDQALCTSTDGFTATLAGNPPGVGTGTWSFVSSIPPRPAPSFSNVNSPTSTVTIALGNEGAYTLRWQVVNGACNSSDLIVIDFGSNPTDPNAGPPQQICGESTNLAANVITIGAGTWSVVSGPGPCVGAACPITIANPNLNTSNISLNGPGFIYGAYTLRWTSASGTCPIETSDVIITFSRPATAAVPGNFTTCVDGALLTPIPLTGSVGAGAGPGQQGRWEIVSGTGTFTSNNGNPGSSIIGPTINDQYRPSAVDFATGSIQLRLVALDPDGIGPCLSVNSPTLTITFDRLPSPAAAGPNFPTCDVSVNLAATAVNNFGTGTWTVGSALYYETFPTSDNGLGITGPNLPPPPTSFTHPNNNWTVSTPAGPNTLLAANDYIRVENGIMTARDVNGNEVVWESSVIPIGGSVFVSADITEIGNNVATDYIRVFYKINGGAEVMFGEIVGNLAVDGQIQTVTATTPPGATVQIVMRARNDGDPDEHRLDNVFVSPAGVGLPIIADVHSPTSSVSNLQVGANTFTWTARSALGVCSSSSSSVTITRNALPVNNNPLPSLCEDTPGSGEATVTLAFLNSLNDAITGIPGSVGRTVQYFIDAPRTIPFVGPELVANTENLFTRVIRTDVAPACVQDGLITFTVNPSPAVVNQNPSFCEETIGGNAINNIDLTFYNNLVTGGAANRAVAWFTDIALTTPVPTPTDVDNVNDGETFFARVTNTITNCQNVGSVEFRINPRPGINPIVGGTNVCVGPTIVLYQIQTINPGATYTWNLPPDNPGFYTRFAGGGPGDFFVLLQFPGLTNAPNPDVYNISVTEISADGCVGLPQPISITVESSPAPNVILGPNPVCKQQTGVVYQTASLNPLSTYSWSIIAGDAAIVGAASGVGLNQVIVDFGTANASTLRVQEVSPTGCSGAAATLVINANDRPVMTSLPTVSLCSGTAVQDALTLTASIPGSTFNWIVTSVTGLVSGSAVGNNGVGQINQTLTNFSGAVGSVTYRVVPTSPDGCAGPSQDVVVTVNPAPVIASGQTRTICSGQPVNKEIFLSPLNLPPGTVFNWPAPVMSDASVQGSAGNNVLAGAPSTFHITDVLVNTSLAPITATYTITPTSGAGCVGVPQTIVVTINPEPVSTNSVAPIFCSGVGFSINPQANITNALPSSFTWTAAYPFGLTGGAANGVGNVSGTLTNLTTAQLSAVYTVTPTSAGGCAGATFTITVPVNPQPVGNNTIAPAICSNVGFNINPQASITNTIVSTFTWTAVYPAGLTGGAANGVGNVAGTLVNLTNIQLSAVFTVTPTSTPEGCVGAPFTITVPVNPEPVGLSTVKAVVCSDSPFSFDPQAEITNGVASTFTWTASYPPGLTGGAGAGVGQIAQTLTNLTGGVLNAVFTVIPTSASSCAGTPFTITVPVDTEPVGANVTKAAQCSNVAFSLNPQDDITNGVPSTFTWTAAYGAGLSGGAGNGTGNITETLVNLTAAPINAVYTVVPTAQGGGCIGNPPFIITVPVNPQPVATNQTKAVVCSNVAFSFDPQTQITNGVISNFTWTAVYPAGLTGGAGAGAGLVAETLVNLTAGQLSAVYTVTPTSVGGCLGATFTITVPINPQPVGTSVTKAAACSNVGFNFNPQVDITNGVASNFSWTAVYQAGLTGGVTNGNGNISETLVNVTGGVLNAVYTVTPTSAAGCAGAPFVITVPVNPEPVGANDIKAIVCSDVAFNFNPQLEITNAVTATFAWTAVYGPGLTGGAGAGIGNVAETLTNLTGASLNATYTITPTSLNGCVGSTFTITVPIASEPVGANSTKAAVCSDTPFSFDPQAEIINGTVATFAWTAAYPAGLTGGAANGTGVINQTLTNQTGGQLNAVFTITPTTAGSCVGSNFTITVPINPEPVGSNAVRPAVCSDVAFNFNPQSDIINGVTSTFAWTAVYDVGLTGGSGAGNGLLSETLTNLTGGPLNAIYTITPTSLNGCVGSTYTITVPVNPEPVGADALKTAVCSDVAFNFNPQLEITNAVTSTFTWTASYAAGITGGSGNGNGAVAETLVNITSAQLSVVYTVTPTSTNGCAGTPFTITVPIEPKPVAINTVKAPVCSDVAFSFDPQDNVQNSITATYTWTAVYDPGLTGGAANGVGLVTGTLTNLTGGTLNAVFTVTPTSTVTNCIGPNFTITVPVRSEPVGANATKAAVCSDVPFNINPQLDITNGIVSTFAWTAVYDAGLLNGSGAGAGPLSETLNNTTGGVLNAVYTVTPTSGNGCEGAPFIITIPVSSEPLGADATKAPVCSNTPFSFDPQLDITNGIVSTFTWTANYDFGLTGGAANGIGNVTGNLQNLTGGVLNAVFTVTPSSGSSCPGSTFTITVPINPQPVGANVTRPAVCSDVPFSLNPQDNITNLVPSTFTWTATYAPGITGGIGVGAGPLAETLHNETGGPLNAVYTVIPTSTDGCVGNPFIITLPVNAEPVMNPNLDATVCSDAITNIVLSTNGLSIPAAAFNITNITVAAGLTPAAGNSIIQNGVNANAIRNDRYNNVTTGSLVVSYTIVPVSPQGCVGDPEVITVTIDPEPVIDPALSPLPACSDVTTGVLLGVAPGSVAAASYNITQINWDLGLQPGPGNASIGAAQPATAIQNDFFTNTTNSPLQARYRVIPVSAAGCAGDEGLVIFTVNPSPEVASNLNAIVCSNEASNIILGTSPTSAIAASYDIMSIVVDAGLTPVTFNPAAPRNTADINEIRNDVFANNTNGVLTVTYNVVAITGAGCRGPVRPIVLRIEPTVLATPVNNTTDICSNTLTNIVLNSPTVPSAGIITFNYQAFASSGLVSGFFPIQSNLPQGHVITDNLVNNDDTPQFVTYRITPVANGAKTGNGCTGNFVDVVVNIEPKPKVIVTPTQVTVCEGIATGFSLTSNTVPSTGSVEFELVNVVATGGVTGFSAIGSIFTNGSMLNDILDNPTAVTQTVTYTLRPQTPAVGCVGDNVQLVVTVNPRPVVTPSSVFERICSGSNINISFTYDVVNTIGLWTRVADANVIGSSPGAGSLLFQTLFNNSNTPGNVAYTVTPTSPAGCQGTPVVINITVDPIPSVTGLPPSITVCDDNSINVPLSSPVAGTVFNWTATPSSVNITGFTSPNSGNVINETLSNADFFPGTLLYQVTPTGPAPTACVGNPATMVVTVAPTVGGRWLTSDLALCVGQTQFLVLQLDGQPPFTATYTATDANGTTSFPLTGLGNIRVIPVSPTLTTTYQLTAVSDVNGCPFVPVGESVTVTVGQTDATFSVVGPATGCSPYTGTFQYNQVAGVTYNWRWFDGTEDTFTAAVSNPNATITHVFTNPSPTGTISYKVTLQTTLDPPLDICQDVHFETVSVFPEIFVNIFPDKDEICSGETINFFNSSIGAATHRWFYRVQGNIGQEIDVRTTQQVSYTFTNTSTQNPIIYEVVYVANNGNCPSPELIIPITVYRAVTAGFDEGVIPPFTGGSSLVTFTNTSVPVDAVDFAYNWDFGIGAVPNTQSGVGPFTVDYTSPGLRDVRVTAVNLAAQANGLDCSSTFSKSINIILPPLVAAFDYTPDAACFPASIEITVNNATGDIYEWQVIDQNGRITAVSTAPLPVFFIANPGEYTIFLRTTNSITGQVAFADNSGTGPNAMPGKSPVPIYPKPQAAFQARPTTLFVPDTELITFNFSQPSNVPSDQVAFLWNFGDTNDIVTRLLGEPDPTYFYPVEGRYTITMVMQETRGTVVCTDTARAEIIAREGGQVRVPNAFTPDPSGPNGGISGPGGVNDVFLPYIRGININEPNSFNMQIYDRWGNLIFESRNVPGQPLRGWDGYDRNGNLLPAGVYVYKLVLRLVDGQRTTQIGDVTMIR
ncbi:MAG TPA: gliding motility-associated C-terminal domain-containing protein [Cyclobacteriaceae bacterium]|nr:gliding motility-associated C-terminal domain-containing protein [Cyclobacteriaceae bacterium]HRJ83148.1 gliding motility-associated C-terminal domain-containing protein [Cyclobacteriaceae bacterium]